jgi:uncharacterized RDD family membrane protein YckC
MVQRGAAASTISPVATDGQLAGWWTRVGAYLLDGVVAGLPGFVLIESFHQGSIGRLVGYLLGAVIPTLYGATLIGRYGRTMGMRVLHIRAVQGTTGRDLTSAEAWGRALAAFGLYQLVGFVLLLIAWSEPAGWSAHRHPMVIALHVVTFVLYLGMFMPLWDSRNQTLQDKAVGSSVVTG